MYLQLCLLLNHTCVWRAYSFDQNCKLQIMNISARAQPADNSQYLRFLPLLIVSKIEDQNRLLEIFYSGIIYSI